MTTKTKLTKAILMIITLVVFCASCSSKKSFQPKYYVPSQYIMPYDESLRADLGAPIEPTKEQLQICDEVIKTVKTQYSFDKPYPTIKCLSNESFNRSSSIKGTSVYDKYQKIIFIPENFDTTGKSYFCHELFHYLSDCDKPDNMIGLEYMTHDDAGNQYLLGSALNEGLTNYFSTKVIPHPQNTSIYEFETHIANQLALAFGEEELWKAYTSNNWSSVRDAFNESNNSYPTEHIPIKLTPFEMLEITLDEYQFLLGNCENFADEYGVDQLQSYFEELILCTDEMLVNYASQMGKAGKSKALIRTLVTNSSNRLNFEVLQYCLA